MPLVPIIMGSPTDLEHAQIIVDELRKFDLPSEVRVASAHKAPAYLLSILEAYELDPQEKVYITVAGRSNALSGVVDSHVSAPVIACPPYSDHFGGADVFSSLRLPSGVAPALVLEPKSAALFAAKILGLCHVTVRAQIVRVHQELKDKICKDDQSLCQRV